jgi:hypothetical protein
MGNSCIEVNEKSRDCYTSYGRTPDEHRAIPAKVPSPFMPPWVK